MLVFAGSDRMACAISTETINRTLRSVARKWSWVTSTIGTVKPLHSHFAEQIAVVIKGKLGHRTSSETRILAQPDQTYTRPATRRYCECRHSSACRFADGRLKCRRCEKRFSVRSVWKARQLAAALKHRLVEMLALCHAVAVGFGEECRKRDTLGHGKRGGACFLHDDDRLGSVPYFSAGYVYPEIEHHGAIWMRKKRHLYRRER